MENFKGLFWLIPISENPQKVTLICENDLMKSVTFCFGEDIETEILGDEHFIAVVEVSVSPNLFGWVFSFGGRMIILSPDSAASEYLDHVRMVAV